MPMMPITPITPVAPATGRRAWLYRLAPAVLALVAGSAMAAPGDGSPLAPVVAMTQAGGRAAGLQWVGQQGADLPAAILAATVALGRDLSRPGVGPFAPLAPLVPLSRIRIVDQGAALTGPRPGDLLSPGGWAGRVALDRFHAGRVIELTGWWGGATLPPGPGRTPPGRLALRSGAASLTPPRPGAVTMSLLPEAGRGPVRGAGPAVLPGARPLGFTPASGETGGSPADRPLPEMPLPVPLPASLVLLGGALVALAADRRRNPLWPRPG
jgi:hypothetical protein